jgi:hypothetical protein
MMIILYQVDIKNKGLVAGFANLVEEGRSGSGGRN